MVYVPAGEFWMGCSSNEIKCSDGEWPQHKVYIDAFYIDKYKVTQGEYDQCVSTGECRSNQKYDGFTGDRQPVVGVDWNDANSYCTWAGKRLPTEAEWEKAARGTDGRIYPWGNEFDGRKVNFCDKHCSKDWSLKRVDDGYSKTAPVGSYPSGASPYGAMDMAGNVWDWVNDWYDGRYYSSSPERNPKGPEGPVSGYPYRVLRGGSWSSFPELLRSSHRAWDSPVTRKDGIGFRCSRTP